MKIYTISYKKVYAYRKKLIFVRAKENKIEVYGNLYATRNIPLKKTIFLKRYIKKEVDKLFKANKFK